MRDSDQVIDRIHYWRPGKAPPRAGIMGRSSLRVGLVGSREMFLNLEPEANLYLLEPDNYTEMIETVSLDLILVESAWNPLSEGWYQFQLDGTPAQHMLHDLLERAAAHGCPCAFWLTEGAAYAGDYAGVARRCDSVFCADQAAVQSFDALGVRASYLPPCVQPARFHPFHDDPFRREGGHTVYFDGWADVDRGLVETGVLEAVAERTGLSVFESRYRMLASRLPALSGLAPYVQGCLTPGMHPVALRRAEVVLSLNGPESERVAREWLAVKAAATGNVLVHLGELGDGDIRSDLARAHTGREAFLADIEWLREHSWSRARLAHTTWRCVMQEHTMAHRVGDVCAALNVEHDWDPGPSVSVVTPTRRPENVERVLANFDQQRYPRKELRIVVNGEVPTKDSRWRELSKRSDVTVDAVPADRFAGACMNRGHAASQADYVMRMDDDDHYGEHYISDVMLALQCVDADVFGKVPVPMRFEGETCAYRRRQRFHPWSVTTGRVLREGKMWLGGNSQGYRRLAMGAPVFPDDVPGAADTVFNGNCPEDATVLVLDPFNSLAERTRDPRLHTWRIGREEFEAHADILEDSSDVMV